MKTCELKKESDTDVVVEPGLNTPNLRRTTMVMSTCICVSLYAAILVPKAFQIASNQRQHA